MEKMERRINDYIREGFSKLHENMKEHKDYLDGAVGKFDKQIKDYRSQVLWRIKDCEELLKSRVANQELNDQIKALESRINAKHELDGEGYYERLRKNFETCNQRIKTCELYVTDKHNDTKEMIKNLELKSYGMATKQEIEKIHESEKTMKGNFMLEFERFQQYLKDQNTRFSKQDTKMRELERSLKRFNELGGIDELANVMDEIKQAKAS